MSARTFRVGLTGGIASGKSTVARLFNALGIPIIDADEISRDVVAPGQPLLSQIAERFGADILTPEGSLNRSIVRQQIFADEKARADLEALTHPAILAEMERQANEAEGPYVILAIPLLVEKNLAKTVDRVLVVDCDEGLQIRRLQARDGATLEQAKDILKAQAPRAQRLQAADDVIFNAGSLHTLRDQVELLHLRYLELAKRGMPPP